jgi:hypothetical protein
MYEIEVLFPPVYILGIRMQQHECVFLCFCAAHGNRTRVGGAQPDFWWYVFALCWCLVYVEREEKKVNSNLQLKDMQVFASTRVKAFENVLHGSANCKRANSSEMIIYIYIYIYIIIHRKARHNLVQSR